MKEIISIYKPECITPLQLINCFKAKFPIYSQEKISAAGRLDPMAEGLILLLIGDANKEREKYQKLDKTYQFLLLPGITTDTYDPLGVVESTSSNLESVTKLDLLKLLPNFIGQTRQAYPAYSSMHVQGKPLFYWARERKLDQITIPTKEITIKSLTLLSCKKIPKEVLIENIIKKIKLVNGDFRQKEIIASWKKSSLNLPDSLPIFSLKATVTSGTYIRSLCSKLGEELGCGGLAYSIERTRIGDFNADEAIKLSVQQS